MPFYIIERNFAEQLDLNADGVAAISKINGDIGVNWVFSFLSADKRKTYCLYEARNPQAIPIRIFSGSKGPSNRSSRSTAW